MNQYLKSIREKEKQIVQLKGEIEDIKDAWISICHPLTVGDVVNGMVIDRRFMYTLFDGSLAWGAGGRMVKKDGKPGNAHGTWSQRIGEVE